ETLPPVVVTPPGRAIGPDDAILDVIAGQVTGEPSVELVMNPPAILEMNPFLPAAHHTVHLLGGHAPNSQERRIDIKQSLRRQTNQPKTLVDRIGKLAESLLTIADRTLRPPAIGHVAGNQNDRLDFPSDKDRAHPNRIPGLAALAARPFQLHARRLARQ